MNLARVRVNDASNDIAGDLLADDAPYTQTILNSAWRWLQRRLATAGVETYIREVFLTQLPIQAVQDVASQAWIGWLGCSDGLNQYQTPSLPQDMILPLSVWQRASNLLGPSGDFCLMTQAQDGLPSWFDYRVYDWRDDGLYFYPQTYLQDWRLRYSAYRPPLDITQPNLTVGMMMCEDCLSARIAYEYSSLRGAAATPQMAQLAEDALQVIVQGSSRRKQRQSIRRQPYSRQYVGNRWPTT